MRIRIALATAAVMFLSLGASAQDWRYRTYRDRDDYRFGSAFNGQYNGQYYGRDRDDRMFFRQGFEQGETCVETGRRCNTDWVTRGMARDDRQAFERGFRAGADKARVEHGWRRYPR